MCQISYSTQIYCVDVGFDAPCLFFVQVVIKKGSHCEPFLQDACSEGLHAGVGRAAAAFGRDPDDVLRGVLDVAGLAMHAVLRVDLQALATLLGIVHKFVHPGRAVAAFRASILGQIDLHGHRGVLERQVRRLIFTVVGAADKDAGEAVKR